MRLAGLCEIEGQLEPDVAGSGAIDANQDVVERHYPSPDHRSKIRLGDARRKVLVASSTTAARISGDVQEWLRAGTANLPP
jgi:hypothetical protein